MTDTISESHSDGDRRTNSPEEEESGWFIRQRTVPWSSAEDTPGEVGTARPPVTNTPADPYVRPVHGPSGYPYATWWRRFAAIGIDGVVITGAWLALWFMLGRSLSAGRVAYLLADLAGGAYFVVLTAGFRGQTPGMRATGIAVRGRNSGGPIGYTSALIRSLVMSALAAPGFFLFGIDCLFPLWQRERQALHDLAAGTVVVEVRLGKAADSTVAAAPAPSSCTESSGASPSRDIFKRIETALGTAIGVLRRLPSRVWIIAGAAVLGIVVLIAGISMVSSFVSSMHSPTKAATSYLEALSNDDVSGMLDNAGIIAPTRVSPNTNVLLSQADIRRELRASGNSVSHVSNVVVKNSTVATNTAMVSISYIADNESHDVTYSLVKSDHTSSGWAVQVTPARLDIDVPTGDNAVTLDGIALHLDGQVAHAYLFPSIATISTRGSATWNASTTTIDTTNQMPNSDPQEVSISAQLLPSASTAALQAVTNQVTSCLAATSLAPANCPNADVPYSANQGDTYSGISWTSYGDPTAGLAVAVDPTGSVTVSGQIDVAATFTDTTAGSPLFGPLSNQQTDGPAKVNFSYPLNWNGSSWVLGHVNLQQPKYGST